MIRFAESEVEATALKTAISPAAVLISPPPETYDYVLANPPFGKKSSMSFANADGEQHLSVILRFFGDVWRLRCLPADLQVLLERSQAAV